MLSPSEWNAAMNGTSWQTAYKVIEVEVATLSWPSDYLTTGELVEEMYPLKYAEGVGSLARNRIFKGLKQLMTRGLQGYCTPSTIPNKYGKYGWRWHAPDRPSANTRSFEKLFEWLRPYLTPDDVNLGREGFLGALSDRIVDNFEALERSKTNA